MNAEALVVHKMAGRIRIRVPSKRGNEAYFTAVKEALSACVGVEGVEVAPFTGSILVRCHGPTEDVIGWAQSRGLFVVREEQSIKVTAFHDAVADRFGALNDRIKDGDRRGLRPSRPRLSWPHGRGHLSDRARQLRRACMVYGFLVCLGIIREIIRKERR